MGANVVIQAITDARRPQKIDKYVGGTGELNMGEWFEILEIDIGSKRAA